MKDAQSKVLTENTNNYIKLAPLCSGWEGVDPRRNGHRINSLRQQPK